MTTKWADSLISAVQYNSAESHIAKVRVHPDNGDTVGAASEMLRSRVISLQESGTTFATITWDATNKKWNYGAAVGIVTLDGEKYIRTDPDRTKKDNLGKLPRF